MRLHASIALVIALTLPGCSSSNNTTQPTEPSGPLVTETFTGTVQPQGASFHVFALVKVSQVYVVLQSAGPPANISMGLLVGTPVGTPAASCAAISATVTAQASTTAQLSGTADPGTYCVQISDVGNATGPVSYTIRVVHQ